MEFRSRRVGDIPPALTSSLLPSFPFWRSPRPGNLRHLLQLNSQRKLTVHSPHYLTKRVRWRSNLTNKRCWCNSPSRRRRRSVCGGLLARNPQAGSVSLLTRRTIVSSLYPTTGQIPMVLVPPLADDTLLAQETESGGRTIRCATYKETSRRRRDCTPTGSEPACQTAEAILIATRNELYGKDNPPVQEVRARLLGLDPDVTPTDAQINASPRFALRSAAVERDAPDIITDHWMPYLEENDRLADCSPEEFNATEGWVPLYPREARRTFAGSFVSLRVGQASPPNGGCTPKLPPRHGQRVHANELSPKGMPAEDVPDDKREAEAGRLLPILWHH